MPRNHFEHISPFPAPYRGPLRRGRKGDLQVLLRVGNPEDREGLRRLRNARAVGALVTAPPGLVSLELAGDRADLLAWLDPGAVPLSLAPPVVQDVDGFLARAVALATALTAVHAAEVVHRGLHPDVLLLDAAGTVYVVGYDEAVPLAVTSAAGPFDPARAGERLPYLAPEQTGRMNRGVDARADLYALGVILFAEFAGHLPLSGEDSAGWVHAHLARAPLALPGPAPIAAIVARLLAKNVEDRYQTAAGLLGDLRALRGQRAEGGWLNFEPSRYARADRFRLSQTLHGRALPLSRLTRAAEEAAAGRPALVLIRGEAGIGKSRLARELEPEAVRRRGYFASGKAPRLERDQPFSALVDALDDLVRQALTRTDPEVAQLRRALRQALGANAGVLATVVPSAARLLPDAPPVPALGAEAARLRLAGALAAFVGAFAQPAHPLMLFLDDLQWADDATLELVAGLLDPVQAPGLLVLGTARDAEVDALHPLHGLLRTAEQRGVQVHDVGLAPLEAAAVADIVAETVASRPSEVRELAALVHAKTGANPFFVGQFLRSLYDEGLLTHVADEARWRWDLAAIARADLTDNVIELLTRALHRLPPEVRRTVLVAAVVGAAFALGTLAELRGLPVAEVAAHLDAARSAGLLVPIDATNHPSVAEAGARLRFAHDRVHEAALESLPAVERVALHRAIGRRLRALLAETMPPDAVDPPFSEEMERRGARNRLLFEACEHGLAGVDAETPVGEREAVAALCLRAARQARSAGAHEVARALLQGAHGLLDARTWGNDESLMLDLVLALAEAERVGGDTARAHALADEVAVHARSALDEAKVLELRTFLLTNQGRLAEAGAQVQALVALLGQPLVPPESQAALFGALTGLVGEVLARSPEALADGPDLRDPALRAVVRVLGASLPTLSMGQPEVHPLAVMKVIRLSLDHGIAPGSAAAFSHLGIILSAVGQPGAAALVGARSEALRHRDLVGGSTEGLVEYPSFIHHWTHPYTDTVALLTVGARRSLELGDPMVFGYCLNQRHMLRVLAGHALEAIEADFAADDQRLRQMGQMLAAWSVAIWAQAVDALRHPSEDPTALVGRRLDAATLAQAEATLPVTRAYAVAARAMLGILFERADVTAAVVAENQAALASAAVAPSPLPPVVQFFEALALADALRSVAAPIEDERLDRLRSAQARLTALAVHAPVNHTHRATLLAAELAAVEGRPLEAMDRFDQAADEASRSGLVHEWALAWQRAAAFHRASGRLGVARGYLRDALAAYDGWGAEALVDHLWHHHADLLGEAPVRARTTGDGLDLDTVLAAAEALGSEREVGPLVLRLLNLVIENTGAERAVFALRDEDGGLTVHSVADASGSSGMPLVPLAHFAEVPHDLLHLVARTGERVLLDDALSDAQFGRSPDIVGRGLRSVLCLPVRHQGQLLGVLHLENTLTPEVFTAERARLAAALTSQAAISLQNALLLTEARGAAARLSDQNAQLTQVDQLRDTILARTSHELRTPLHGIIGLVRSLLDGAGGPLAPPVKQNLQMVATSGQRLAHLIDDILDFSTLREDRLRVELQPVDAAEVVDRVLALLAPLADAKGLRMARVGPTGPATVQADADRIEQVLLNLVGNAIKFTDAGAVTVRLDRQPGAADGAPTEGTLRFSVTDTGPGIAAADQQRIFEPFDQGADGGLTHKGGAGLGLSVAQQLVARHGGPLNLHSTPGEGATFWFDLPLVAGRRVTGGLPDLGLRAASRTRPDTAPMPSLPTANPTVPATGPRLLAVDDEPINLQVLLQTLSPLGFRVETALSGPEALERLRQGPLPDLVLLDVMMPGMDGLDVCRQIRRTHPASALPVVMVTARNRSADLAEGLAAGANDYVSKPFSATELQARIGTHLRVSALHHAVARFVPRAFVDLLGHTDVGEVKLGDHIAQRMTVLFADMRAFGRLARSLDPRGSFEFVNQYLGALEPVVIAHGGFVDKYIGDKVMALFAGDPAQAVAAGVAMLGALDAFNAERLARGEVPIRVGIGLNTGDLMLGTVGSPGRMDTTVISDAVNLASKVEALTRRFSASLLATGATVDALRRPPHCRLLDQLRTDTTEIVDVFEIYAGDPVGARAGKDATLETFERGVRAFHERLFEEATRSFQVCQALTPSDPAVRHYLERCARVRQYFAGEGL